MPVVTVLPEGISVELRPRETVLQGLHRAGYAISTGCRRGGCGICKVDLVTGEVEYHKTVAETVLSPAERTSGACLTCRSVPVGDISITLRNGKLRRICSLLAAAAAGTPAAGGAGAHE